MTAHSLLSAAAAIALVAGPAPPAGLPAAGAPAGEAAAGCRERSALESERSAINARIGDIALGKHRKKRKASGGEVAAGVAGTAASVLLPFGIGALLGAGAGAAAKSGRKKRPAPPEPDVAAMVDRLRSIDARLAQIEACA